MMNARIHGSRRGGVFALVLLAASCGGSPSESSTDAGTETTSTTDAAMGAPTVLSTVPTTGAADVRVDTPISATFSEDMDPATLNADIFTLFAEAGSPVQGTVSYADSTVVFSPSTRLSIYSPYSAAITTGARSASGVELEGTLESAERQPLPLRVSC